MKKILIANRGEIALRIIRSLKEMNIATVAVYSEADRTAPFVLAADEAVLLGPPPSSESYLLGDLILKEALKLGVDGIHPGYGFLSENADFATKVDASGIRFIGPSPHAITLMGSKLAAKETVAKYDIPMVPGTDGAVQDLAEGVAAAKEIGFPVLIKASAGGGGKGMRIVHKESEFEEQLERAISEAENAFGDGSVFIERFVTSPRHIEIQILADDHGNVVHLFERECSIQRRHQKVVEEAPSAVLDADLRKRMGEAAVNVAKSCQYTGAGTVEFLLDENKDFFFLEMNTRLQVEHPVTEAITGIDLVKEQVKVARGEKLPFTQKDLTMTGHAIELRVYAEDAYAGFLPDIGTLEVYSPPMGPGIRVDDGFREGMEVPVYYDPMISKLTVHAATRLEAIEKMRLAIAEYEIVGITTTLPFGEFVMAHEAFRSGDFDTNFVKKYFEGTAPAEMDSAEQDAALAVASYLINTPRRDTSSSSKDVQEVSNWNKNRILR